MPRSPAIVPLLVLIAAISLGLAGCGGGDDGADTTETVPDLALPLIDENGEFDFGEPLPQEGEQAAQIRLGGMTLLAADVTRRLDALGKCENAGCVRRRASAVENEARRAVRISGELREFIDAEGNECQMTEGAEIEAVLGRIEANAAATKASASPEGIDSIADTDIEALRGPVAVSITCASLDGADGS